MMNQDSRVSIMTGYRLDEQCSVPNRAAFFSSPKYPEWLQCQPSLLSNGYWSFDLRGKVAEV